MTTLEQHIAAVQPLLKKWGDAAVFGCIFAEGVGIPAPGQTLLVAAALLAGRGELALAPLLVVFSQALERGLPAFWMAGLAS